MKLVSEKWGVFVAFMGWAFLGAAGAWGQHFDECAQNIDNATIVIPASVQASVGGASLEPGDEIAVFTDDGACAGWGIWDEEHLSIAAASAGSQQPIGFEPGERIRFRVWSASEEQKYEAEVSYATCAEGEALCRDDGRYESKRVFKVKEINANSTGGTDSTGSPEFASFEVTRDGEETILAWQATLEAVSKGFEVQHQGPYTEGRWVRAGFVEGQDAEDGGQRYTYRVRDLSPGTHRFRIKKVDLDGTFAYSAEVEAAVALAGTYDVVAPYPNPFRQQVTFALTVATGQHIDIVAYNQLGQRVATLHDGQLEPDTPHTFRLDGTHLSSGLYFIRIRGEEFSATERAIRIR